MEEIRIAIVGLFLIFAGTQTSAQTTIDDLLRKYNSGDIPYISVEELRMKQLKNQVLILDSRTPEEYSVSHIEGAIFMGVDKKNIPGLDNISRDKPIVVYCALGVRSEDAASWLKELGFTNVSNLYGGIFKWKNIDYPVVTPEGNSTEKVHAFSKHWSKWLHNAEKIY